ncbi:MAG: hypothetical protein KTR28_06255, partial [Micavibrio sp.]|nr:hypothetical protein [Micavibrio sp.]
MNKFIAIPTVVLLGAIGISAFAHPVQAAQIKNLQLEFTNDKSTTLPSPYELDSTKKSEVEESIFTEEPYFKEVKFLKLDEPQSLSERIDRLMFGIKTDVPPEYDVYGYEMRRYMAGIGDANRITDIEFLTTQLVNVKKAEIILQYWEKALRAEMDAIEQIIEEKNETSSVRSTYKYNRGVVNAFLTEAKYWTLNNRKMLQYLIDIGPKVYRYESSTQTVFFKTNQNVREFNNIYTAKILALKEIREYMP